MTDRGGRTGAHEFLTVDSVRKSFGGVTAVDGISFSVNRGDTVGIIGPNGAGKTTVFNLITGFYRPDRGSIRFCGHEITRVPPYRLAHLGIARTFQNLRLFGRLTVLENIRSAALSAKRYSLIAGVFRTGSFVSVEREAEKEAQMLLDFFGLSEKENAPAGSLPYGDQRKLELARALAVKPDLLLIDEPGAGMNPREIQDLVKTMDRMKERFSLTIALIEHQMGLVMNISHRVIVMDFGEKIMEGTPDEVRRDKRVIEAYLGDEFPCS